jgi:RNA polymerase sigma-70 factor (ECF subfamily)
VLDPHPEEDAMTPNPHAPTEPSFTLVAQALKHGDDDAWRELLTRYSRRLIALARSRLFDGRLRSKLDAEDLVQSVYRTFLRRHCLDRFSLGSWEEIWALLMVLTVRRACGWHDFFTAQKRDVRREESLSAASAAQHEDQMAPALVDPEPTPAEAVALLETLDERLAELSERERKIIRLGLLGHDAAEISVEAQSTEYRIGLAQKEFLETLLVEIDTLDKESNEA